MDFEWLKDEKVVEVIGNYALLYACGDDRDSIKRNLSSIKKEAKIRGIAYEETLNSVLENKELLEKVVTEVCKEYPEVFKKWGFVPANHHRGFLFAKTPVYPVTSRKQHFSIKYENGFLYLHDSKWDKKQKKTEILAYAEEMFHQFVEDEHYFVFDYDVPVLKRMKDVPVKAVGEKAERILHLLQQLPKEQFSFCYNRHGMLVIDREKGKKEKATFWLEPNFSETPFVKVNCLEEETYKNFLLKKEEDLRLFQ